MGKLTPQQYSRWLRRFGDEIDRQAMLALDAVGTLAERYAAANASGRVLNRRSGRLAASVRARVSNDGGRPTLTLSSDAPYARIHEYGGTIQGNPLLTFQTPSGVWVSAKQVTIPRRPWVRPAIEEAVQTMPREFTRRVLAAAQFRGL
ncbi:MAG: HK97 gp10 family phage protein [Myxococcota bacterium]